MVEVIQWSAKGLIWPIGLLGVNMRNETLRFLLQVATKRATFCCRGVVVAVALSLCGLANAGTWRDGFRVSFFKGTSNLIIVLLELHIKAC